MKIQFNYWISHLFLFFVVINLINQGKATEDVNVNARDKHGRFLGFFEVIKFPNDACTGDSKNGTCYTAQECKDKDGTEDGTCASGYGVCCTFSLNCGGMSSENNTYFVSSGSESAGACSVQVCPGENICQLRLDFTSFIINGPYTSTTTTNFDVAVLNGAMSPGDTGTKAMITNSQCTVDSFTVTSSSGTSPPTICGDNANEHIYVDASPGYCNTLGFSIGSGGGISRAWSIGVAQYACDYTNLAPSGCTQYFFGESSGTFRSFNYQAGAGKHLASQNHNFCFRL